MGPQRILVGTSDYSDPRRGGMASFDASSGRLVHRYQLSYGGRLWSYNASDITTSEGQYVYASCRYGAGEQGAIGTWDQTTGQQVHQLSLDDLYLSLGYNMCKLQWLRESNCLLVATMEVNDGGCLSLLDLRSRKVVWPQFQGGRRGPVVSEDRIMDALAIESSWTIWVVDDSDRLGFIDTRTGSDQITWGKPGDVFPVTPWDTHSPYIRHPKLAYWGSRLFASRDESVHVLASHDWNTNEFSETATVQRAKGGEIADISIGGDRLFLLHKETDSFEVWETPRKRGTANFEVVG